MLRLVPRTQPRSYCTTRLAPTYFVSRKKLPCDSVSFNEETLRVMKQAAASTGWESNVDKLIPTRWSLIGRLRNWDDQESWRDFFETYWKLIYGVSIRSGLNDAAARDVVQETIVSLATSLRDGRYD